MDGTGICLFCQGPAEEEHHVALRRVDPELTAPLCAACHRRAHRDLEEAGVQLDTPGEPDLLGRLVLFLRAVGSFLLSLGERVLEWAQALERVAAGLCEGCRALISGVGR